MTFRALVLDQRDDALTAAVDDLDDPDCPTAT
jgi:hypothetical protein